MEEYLKSAMEQWLDELKTEKDHLQTLNKAAEVNLEVLNARYYVTDSAMKKLPHSKRDAFNERYVKPIEDQIESHKKLMDKQKVENSEKISELNALIATIQERL